jgi:periplasmic copper chaperone A
MHSPRTVARVRTAAGGALLVVVLAACGAPGTTPGVPASGSPTAAAPSGGTSAPRTVPLVSDAWVRPPIGPDRPAGGYLTITGSAIDDALTGAASPVAGRVELHETTADASGMAAMHPVHRLEIPAASTVTLAPGGYHLMLMDLTERLEPGTTVDITLTFEGAGEVTVQAEVRSD